MKNFEQIEHLIKSKAYEELTDTERALVDQELTKDTYEELRESISLIQNEKISVRKDIKQSLMAELKQQERGVPSWIRFKLPAYTHAVPLLIIVYLLFLVPHKEKVVTQDRIVEVKVRDTVLITKTDTLWRERLIKVPTPIYVTQKIESEPVPIDEVGKRSLSDQKEIMDLVVRGD